MKWLYLLFRSDKCRHKWKIIKTTDVYEFHDSKMPYATRYTLQCTKCGDIMSKRV